jgi:hypothetical protein
MIITIILVFIFTHLRETNENRVNKNARINEKRRIQNVIYYYNLLTKHVKKNVRTEQD